MSEIQVAALAEAEAYLGAEIEKLFRRRVGSKSAEARRKVQAELDRVSKVHGRIRTALKLSGLMS